MIHRIEVRIEDTAQTAAVRDAFAANSADGADIRAALSVYLKGEKAVDLWGGVAVVRRVS